MRNSVQENRRILQDAQAEVLIFGSDALGQVDALQKHVPSLKMFICHGQHKGISGGAVEDYETVIANGCPQEPNIEVDEDDVYRIHYTSGTTGHPQGILHTYVPRRSTRSMNR